MKTLKDIEYFDDQLCVTDLIDKDGAYRRLVEERLRQAAIEWIKKIIEIDTEDRKTLPKETWYMSIFSDYSDTSKIQVINFIKHFFNLTKEDLK